MRTISFTLLMLLGKGSKGGSRVKFGPRSGMCLGEEGAEERGDEKADEEVGPGKETEKGPYESSLDDVDGAMEVEAGDEALCDLHVTGRVTYAESGFNFFGAGVSGTIDVVRGLLRGKDIGVVWRAVPEA